MKIEPVHLEGRFVRLEPLADAHADGLLACSRDDSIWRYMPFRIEDEEGARGWIAYAAQLLATQEGMLFATVDRATGEVVGSTGFLAPAASHRRVEIGGTWVTPARQRSAVNTEAKLLMLAHAFDAWDCIRVEFKTDSRNEKSRRALRRIGASEEGTLRNHMILPDGHLRHSVYFSILADEWPAVRAALEARLGA